MNVERQYFLLRYFCMIGTIIFGSGSTLITKRLDIIGFYYPLFQTGLMFFGETFCSFLFLLALKKRPPARDTSNSFQTREEPRNCLVKTGKFAFCISATFDFIGSFMEYFSYNLLKASGIVTFKMMVIVFIILYRVFVLKRSLYRHQKLGLLFLSIGFVMVGSEVCFNSQETFTWNQNAGLGILCMILAQIFNALVIILQEYQMNLIRIAPQEVITIQGVTGLLICSILYAPFRYLFGSIGYSTADMSSPFLKMKQDVQVCALIVSLVIVIGLLNFFQVKTIKVSDSLSLCTVDSGRVILVWILAIAFSFENALPVEIVGGASLIFGIVVYNEVVIIPCCGMKKSAKTSMKESQIYRELKIKDREWQNNLDSIL